MSAAAAGVEVREARGDAERRALMALRHAVFVGEQGVPVELEVDEHDVTATHLVVLREGAVVATCRLVGDGEAVKLGRLAVAAPARRRGLARRLLDEAEARARSGGARRLVLSAQTAASALYLGAGFRARGRPYDEAGIEHVRMEKALA